MRMLNIVRFNWPMYVQALVAAAVLSQLSPWLAAGALYLVVSSLLVSFYVYDMSGLYGLGFLPDRAQNVLNLHAGYDETSLLLKRRYPQARLSIFDFYDPTRHTEPSIRRARAHLPPLPETESCSTDSLPLQTGQDLILCFMSLHEIRSADERVRMLREIKRVLRGTLFVVEHQRDLANFLAFGPGFAHFHAPGEWRRNFEAAGLELVGERSFTPFLRIFQLQ